MTTRNIIINNQKIAEVTLPDDTTEEQWREVLSVYVPESLEELKDKIITQVHDRAKFLYEKLTEKYSSKEAASWTQKEAESREFLQTGLVTIKLKNEAIARYPDLSEFEAISALAITIAGKADYLHSRSAKIAGTRGRHCDAIAFIQSKEELENYNWQDGW